MPIKKCKLGFDCALMMQQPGIFASECENADTCGTISCLSDEEIFQQQQFQLHQQQLQLELQLKTYSFICKYSPLISLLNVVRQTNYNINSFSYSLQIEEIIIMQLLSRKGLVFAKNNFDFDSPINHIIAISNAFSEHFNNNNFLMTPFNSEINSYNVKRPYGIYEYWQISSPSPIFNAVFISNKANASKKYSHLTKKIHLGKEGSPKFAIAFLGWLNRDKLSQALSKLYQALKLLNEAFDILRDIDDFDD